MMSEEKMFVWLCTLVLLACVLFAGEPDLVDAWIMLLLRP
jgi:hypothetical protein